MQDSGKAKQLLIDQIRKSSSILVAVSNSPSVDNLSAALALALMLNKLDKYSTAIFSGQIPKAMQFLEPAKTFESNVDSLRDFIISLDKEKADRLRYKVEDDVVRIYITPYRSVISEKDLNFSQGDFNVDLVIALGVEKRDDLDKAIIAHGRILHDATVATVNISDKTSSLGTVDWHDPTASSLCEMLVDLSEALQQPGLIDTQISTALLTGIVAATERFSNQKTSPKVMTIAAQMMAAGANQQLIANNIFQQSVPPAPKAMAEPAASAPAKQGGGRGELNVRHGVSARPKMAEKPVAPQPKQEKNVEAELAAALPQPPAPAITGDEIKKELLAVSKKSEPADGGPPPVAKQEPPDYVSGRGSWKAEKEGEADNKPTLGGTLNATTEEAMEEKEKAEDQDRNKIILSHNGSSGSAAPPPNEILPAVPAPAKDNLPPTLPVEPSATPDVTPALTMPAQPPAVPAAPSTPAGALPELNAPAVTPANADKPSVTPLTNVPQAEQVEAARQAVSAAFGGEPAANTDDITSNAAPASSVNQPDFSSMGLPPMPPPLPPAGDTTPLPPVPPVFGTEKPLPPSGGAQPPIATAPVPAAPTPAPSAMPTPSPAAQDPGQFQIPV